MEQVYTPSRDYKVLVNCMTYNQSKYIEDALNGFAMQKTDFPFVCLVMDDASTDGEQEVIKAWMARECDMEKAENVEIEKSFVTLIPHKSNLNCQFAFYFLKENLYKKGGKMPMVYPWRECCEYEALCEGDDYWIHPGKLQMQAEFLDDHKDYGLVRTEINRYFQDECRLEKCFFTKIKPENNKDTFQDYIMNSWFAAPCTWMFRPSLISSIPKLDSQKCFTGDALMMLHFSSCSLIHFEKEVTAVYRVLEDSASHFKTYQDTYKFTRRVLFTRIYYAKQQPFSFRMKFWWSGIVLSRPSFRHLRIIPLWCADVFVQFFNLFF